MTTQEPSGRIPVVDIFAGPGGLGEGFARYPYKQPGHSEFEIRLSIEKDRSAHETLLLRSFTRQFSYRMLPAAYYRLLKDTKTPLVDRVRALFEKHPEQAEAAQKEALCAELGKEEHEFSINRELDRAVGRERDWVLLGGPPCQAYSIAGRVRNLGIEGYRPEEDARSTLYREYLKVIATHLPTVFVMENVKGLLSATLNNEKIFENIIADLKKPLKSLGIGKKPTSGVGREYRLFALGEPSDYQTCLFEDNRSERPLTDFVIRMEDHGIPQARHRLIILGIREDVGIEEIPLRLNRQTPVSLASAIGDLPRIRSGLSKESDNAGAWQERITELTGSVWYRELVGKNQALRTQVDRALQAIVKCELTRGDDWFGSVTQPALHPLWFGDRKIKGVFNHQTRGHKHEDLHRYLFASCYAKTLNNSPLMKDFPKELLPDHKNIGEAVAGKKFADRFRVQVADRPSTTITSHISKDGHYYIHPDPTQCRSLTVREAARLQTFPDNYFFCGPRTSQYTQVGNAVPPFLAHQIAEIVHAILSHLNRN